MSKKYSFERLSNFIIKTYYYKFPNKAIIRNTAKLRDSIYWSLKGRERRIKELCQEAPNFKAIADNLTEYRFAQLIHSINSDEAAFAEFISDPLRCGAAIDKAACSMLLSTLDSKKLEKLLDIADEKRLELGYKEPSLNEMLALVAIPDYSNITERQAQRLIKAFGINEGYVLFKLLLKKDILKKLLLSVDFEQYHNRVEKNILLEILRDAPYEQIPTPKNGTLSDEDITKLCKDRPEYLKMLPQLLAQAKRGTANAIWNNTNASEDIRTLAILAQCCAQKTLPKYQCKKLKDFGALIRVYNWNYLDLYNTYMAISFK